MDNYERILQVIKDNLSKDIEIKSDNLWQDLKVDSINFIQIIVALEKEFNLEFEDKKLSFAAFPRVKDMIDYIISRKEEEVL